jgi:hypothetical protein
MKLGERGCLGMSIVGKIPMIPAEIIQQLCYFGLVGLAVIKVSLLIRPEGIFKGHNVLGAWRWLAVILVALESIDEVSEGSGRVRVPKTLHHVLYPVLDKV